MCWNSAQKAGQTLPKRNQKGTFLPAMVKFHRFIGNINKSILPACPHRFCLQLCRNQGPETDWLTLVPMHGIVTGSQHTKAMYPQNVVNCHCGRHDFGGKSQFWMHRECTGWNVYISKNKAPTSINLWSVPFRYWFHNAIFKHLREVNNPFLHDLPSMAQHLSCTWSLWCPLLWKIYQP